MAQLATRSQPLTHDLRLQQATSVAKSALFMAATQSIDMNDATVTLCINAPGSGETQLKANILLVDANSSGPGEILKLPAAETYWYGEITILNAGGERIYVAKSDGTILAYVGKGEGARVWTEGTTVLAAVFKVHDTNARDSNRIRLFDDFLTGLVEASSPYILNSGSDAQAVDPAHSAVLGGVLALVSGDVGGGDVAVDGSQVVTLVPFQAQGGSLVMEARVALASIAAVAVVVGFTDSTALEMAATVGSSDAITTTASDMAAFVFDTAADTDEWFAIACDGDSDDTDNGATGVAPTAGTYQRLRIEVGQDGATVLFFINDVLVKTLEDAGVSPDVNLYATVAVISRTTASKTVNLDFWQIESDRLAT